MADKKNEFDDVPEKKMPAVNLTPKKDKANLLAQAALTLADKCNFRFNVITRSYEIQELLRTKETKNGKEITHIEKKIGAGWKTGI